MPFQMLDLILVAIMLVSGLLALMRGFTREVLSLVAWGGAAAAAFFALHTPALLDIANKYLQPEIAAKIAVAGGVFVVVLILISIISVKISDLVVDSAAGVFDRTLGFAYGLARGLVLVVIAYMIYSYLVPPDRQYAGVKNAQSLPMILSVSEMIKSVIPPDIAESITNATNVGSGSGSGEGQGDGQQGTEPATGETTSPEAEGYQKNEAQGLDQLIQGGEQPQTGETGEQPAFGGQTNPN
jgi:membrane protein required for colicin V production